MYFLTILMSLKFVCNFLKIISSNSSWLLFKENLINDWLLDNNVIRYKILFGYFLLNWISEAIYAVSFWISTSPTLYLRTFIKFTYCVLKRFLCGGQRNAKVYMDGWVNICCSFTQKLLNKFWYIAILKIWYKMAKI